MINLNIIKTDDRPLLDCIRDRLKADAETLRREIVEDILQLDGAYFALTWTITADGASEFRLWAGEVKDHGDWFHLRLEVETEGPSRFDCPPWLIDLAPAFDDKAANAWRRLCIDRAASKSQGLAYGAILVFTNPIRLSDGHKSAAFRYLPGRCKENGCVFKSLKNQKFYAIPHFLDRDYAVKAAS